MNKSIVSEVLNRQCPSGVLFKNEGGERDCAGVKEGIF